MKSETSRKSAEDVAKILYVRLPHTIRNAKEIEELFPGDVQVKLTRKASRHCHVIFPSVAEKIKNLKNVKKKKIDGRNVIAHHPRINPPEKRKKAEKKLRIPKPKVEERITKTLHVSNVKPGTKAIEVKDAFPGCASVVLVKSKNTANRIAMVKFGSLRLAGEYLRKEREPPEVRGNRLVVRSDTRKKKKRPSDESSGLKIYDGKGEANGATSSKAETKSPNSKDEESENSEESEDEDQEEEEASDSNESIDVEEE